MDADAIAALRALVAMWNTEADAAWASADERMALLHCAEGLDELLDGLGDNA